MGQWPRKPLNSGPTCCGPRVRKEEGAGADHLPKPAFGALAEVLALDLLPREDAIDFLLARTGDPDRDSAAEFAELLDSYPLALSRREPTSRHVRARSPAIYASPTIVSSSCSRSRPASGHSHTVRTTWELAFEAVGERSSAALELLALAAFLARTRFRRAPRRLSRSCSRRRSRPPLGTRWRSRRRSVPSTASHFVRRTTGGFSLHRLVQLVTRERLGLEERQRHAGHAVRLLAHGFVPEFDGESSRQTPRSCWRMRSPQPSTPSG